MSEKIDVSECEYAEKSIPVDCSIDNCFCYENKNCYYKQLKRLEADYKKLKEELEQIKGICKEAISLCNCFDADVDYNCINCRDGGRAKLAKEIMEVLKDEH